MPEYTEKKKFSLVRYLFQTEYDPGDAKGPAEWTFDHYIFYFSLAILLIGAAYSVYTLINFTPDREAVVTCSLRGITGLYCPGCGATHALHELLHGHILLSLQYNTLIPVLLFTLIPYFILGLLHLMTKGKVWRLRFHIWYLGIYAFIILAHFVWVNYYLLVHGVHLIP